MTKKYCPECSSPDLYFWNYTSDKMATCLCGWTGQVYFLLKEPKPPMPTPKLKYVSIDIETTGLNPDTCQVLELGAVIEDWISPISELQTFRYVLLHDKIIGEPFALALNANLLKLISNPPENYPCLFGKPCNLGSEFAAWLKSNYVDPRHVQPAGKNFASFDAQFLKRVPNFNEHINFKHRTIDPAMLFWQLDDEKLPDTATCMKRSGIDGKVAHTAVEDAIAVVKMIRFWANNT